MAELERIFGSDGGYESLKTRIINVIRFRPGDRCQIHVESPENYSHSLNLSAGEVRSLAASYLNPKIKELEDLEGKSILAFYHRRHLIGIQRRD